MDINCRSVILTAIERNYKDIEIDYYTNHATEL